MLKLNWTWLKAEQHIEYDTDVFCTKMLMETSHDRRLHIAIDTNTDDELNVIMKAIEKELRRWKKAVIKHNPVLKLSTIDSLRTPKHFRKDEIERYLRIFDLWKSKMKMKDIIRQINPNLDENSVDVLRAFRQTLQKQKNY